MNRGQYKRFVNDVWENAVLEIHNDRISEGRTRTRETRDASINTFVKTQKGNMRDYADACFRYLRITGFVSIAHKSRTISIFDDKKRDVEFILANVNRNPVFVNDEDSYKAHLFDATTPELYTDNVENIIDVILRMSEFTRRDLANYDIEALKDLRDDIVAQHKENVIHEQVAEIKSYALYSEIIDTFNEIVSDEYYDAPLMFEYNTWRAMTMLDGGKSKIIPLELDQFMRLVENSYSYKTQPTPTDIRHFLDCALKLCEKAVDENNWRCGIQECVDMWLAS